MTGSRSEVAWEWGDEGGKEGKGYKGAGGNFEGNGNVCFLHCGDGFIGVHRCSYLSNYKLHSEICNLR